MLDLFLDGFFQLAGWLHERRRPNWHEAVRAAGLFPAYADGMGAFAVDSRGRVWYAAHPADWSKRAAVLEPEPLHVALTQAARLNREARTFAPVRASDAQLCPSCGGSGVPNLPPRHRYRILCECGGTGWLPAGWRPDHTRAGRNAEHARQAI